MWYLLVRVPVSVRFAVATVAAAVCRCAATSLQRSNYSRLNNAVSKGKNFLHSHSCSGTYVSEEESVTSLAILHENG